MAVKIIVEIMVLWVWFAVYMEILVRKKGPVGGAYFYPKQVQQRIIELGLRTKEQIKKERNFAYILLAAGDLIIPFIMIVIVNGTRTFWDCVWQYYVLFYGMEFYDWFMVDTLWVAKSSWWVIPGTEDLLHLWHDPKLKSAKMLKLLVITIPVAVLVGGIYCLIGMLL